MKLCFKNLRKGKNLTLRKFDKSDETEEITHIIVYGYRGL